MAIISWFFCIGICVVSLAWGQPSGGDYSFPEACQALTPENPLEGCAIDSLPHDDTSHTVLILSGTYTEQLNITQPGPLTLLGESNSPHNASTNSVHVRWAAATEQGIYTDNVYTSVLIVAPTLNASLTGSGPEGLAVPDGTPFGCSDFRTYNIDFRNSAGPANALSFSRANGGFYYSGFYSYQDTVYVGKLGNAYFHSSIVAKQTDFLYGFGTAWLELCGLVLRGCGAGITAWKGTNTTYPNKFGVYVHASSINAANASVVVEQKGRCALGRPWNSGHRSIFAEIYEDGTIQDSGYVLWQAPITEQTLMGVARRAMFSGLINGSGGGSLDFISSVYHVYGTPSHKPLYSTMPIRTSIDPSHVGNARYSVDGQAKRRQLTHASKASHDGQAVACTGIGLHQGFYGCGFKSYQDTLYAKSGMQYYSVTILKVVKMTDTGSVVGAVDYIFGDAAAWFGECTMISSGGGYITASSRTYGTDQAYVNSQITAAAGASVDGKVFLGRPWRPLARVIYQYSTLTGVAPMAEGATPYVLFLVINWEMVVINLLSRISMEYENTGAGSNTSVRLYETPASATMAKSQLWGGDTGWYDKAY
ncbi:unnamed protein product [Aspergillus oryzae RIB40]|uniref:Pectinesterase n=1 Tax=Aspergillus oryzae (strain ATCC 42149 / RIB 40) TaxID=510516 RepID=Q2U5R4_ASPOR|nr:unnamed protein product [Aspergillus oryzae RIB40]BAE63101.1 unnamed protein product [Aspergillus oryzae RIB40]